MLEWIKHNSIAFAVAVTVHVLFFGVLLINWQMDKPKKIVMEQGEIIQVTSVDANSYDAEIKKIEQQKNAEQQRQQRLEKARQEKKRKAEADRKAREQKKKQEKIRRQKEKQRQAKELKRKKAAKEKKQREAKKKAVQEKKRKAAEKKAVEKKAAEKKRNKAEAKRKAEQKKAEQKKRQLAEQKRKAAEKQRQAELQRQQQRDRAEQQRRSKGIVNRHVAMIAQKIERHWRQPLDAPSNLQCKIDIVLRSNGQVDSVKVVESSGNLSFDRSVELAVRRASPLPVPTDSVIFKQFEVMRLRFEPGR